jgi:hypothetical protein
MNKAWLSTVRNIKAVFSKKGMIRAFPSLSTNVITARPLGLNDRSSRRPAMAVLLTDFYVSRRQQR